jgi:hypothetical protein
MFVRFAHWAGASPAPTKLDASHLTEKQIKNPARRIKPGF